MFLLADTNFHYIQPWFSHKSASLSFTLITHTGDSKLILEFLLPIVFKLEITNLMFL
jgi:hypothetical protein